MTFEIHVTLNGRMEMHELTAKKPDSERFQAQNHNPGIAGTRITHESAFHIDRRYNINAGV
jgi:hypothetical protein